MRVVIIGGGAVGASAAYHLAADPGFPGEIVVIERDPTYARASTTLSAASIRTQFSTPVNIALSQYGFRFLRAAEATLGVDVGLRERGYLMLASEAGAPVLRANHATQRAAGAAVDLLDPEALGAFGWLSTEGVALGALGRRGEGWFDAASLLAGLRGAAIRLGARFIAAEACGFTMAGARVAEVRTADGGRFPCDHVLCAAGAWSGAVAAWAGLPVPIRPGKRTVFHVLCREGAAVSAQSPLIVDPSGVWVRPEGAGFICGVSPDPENDPEATDFAPDWSQFEEIIWPALAARIPVFEALKVSNAWAGWYEMCDWDHNGLVGPLPGAENLLIAAGFSGHGLQHSPGVGRAIAEWLIHREWRSLDMSPLAASRVSEGRRLVELEVI
jgi:glycine/D-amino acid oxidase-like deaminating enzyme